LTPNPKSWRASWSAGWAGEGARAGAVDGEARDAGHRGYRTGVGGALGDEDRRDEVVDVDSMFANEAPHDGVAA